MRFKVSHMHHSGYYDGNDSDFDYPLSGDEKEASDASPKRGRNAVDLTGEGEEDSA